MIRREVATLERQSTTPQAPAAIEQSIQTRLAEYRALLRARVSARQIVRKVLRDRVTFTPETRGEARGYRLQAEGYCGKSQGEPSARNTQSTAGLRHDPGY